MLELYENITDFPVGLKTFEISACIENLIFAKNVHTFEILRQIFS